MNTIVVDNFTLGYRRSSARGGAIFPAFSLDAKPTEMIALIGRNGIGKSTFLRTLVGLQKPLGGSLQVMGKAITDYSACELASIVSFVSTENIRIQNLKVFNLVALGRHPHTNWFGTLVHDDKAKVIEAIDKVGIRHLMWRNISQLSDGELQRAMIARTLAQDTPIIILDEPTAFLDLPNKYEIILLLRRLAHEQNKTVIFSTHDLGIAMRLVDKIWLMATDGMQQGAPEDLAMHKNYDKLFENTLLSFNQLNGSIDLGIPLIKEITVSNNINANYWIKRALERIGYNVITNVKPNTPQLEMISDNEKLVLKLKSGNLINEFADIYSLSRFLLSNL